MLPTECITHGGCTRANATWYTLMRSTFILQKLPPRTALTDFGDVEVQRLASALDETSLCAVLLWIPIGLCFVRVFLVPSIFVVDTWWWHREVQLCAACLKHGWIICCVVIPVIMCLCSGTTIAYLRSSASSLCDPIAASMNSNSTCVNMLTLSTRSDFYASRNAPFVGNATQQCFGADMVSREAHCKRPAFTCSYWPSVTAAWDRLHFFVPRGAG